MKNTYNRGLIYAEVSATRGTTDLDSFSRIYGVPASRVNAVKRLYHEKKFKFWWYGVFLAATLVCFILAPSGYLSCIETLLCLLVIDFQGRAKITGQVLGIVECLLYAFISYSSLLYGEAIKSLVINLPITIFALVSWIKSAKANTLATQKSKRIKIKKLSKLGWILSFGAFAVVAIIGYFLLGLLNTKLLVLSAITFSISLVAKFLMAMCFKEGWIFTLMQAGISTILWASNLITSIIFNQSWQNALPLVVLDLAILSNAIYSYILWRVMFKRSTKGGGVILNLRPLKVNNIIKLRHRFRNLKWDKHVDISKNS